MGKLPVSHRYNRLPLLPSDSGGFQQELVAQDLPGAKVGKIRLQPNEKCKEWDFNEYWMPDNFYARNFGPGTPLICQLTLKMGLFPKK